MKPSVNQAQELAVSSRGAKIVLEPYGLSTYFSKRECTLTEPLKVGSRMGNEDILPNNLIFECSDGTVSSKHALIWFKDGKVLSYILA